MHNPVLCANVIASLGRVRRLTRALRCLTMSCSWASEYLDLSASNASLMNLLAFPLVFMWAGARYTFLSRWVCMRADLDGKLWPRERMQALCAACCAPDSPWWL